MTDLCKTVKDLKSVLKVVKDVKNLFKLNLNLRIEDKKINLLKAFSMLTTLN